MTNTRPKFRLRFFWQLISAFSLIILLVVGGMFLASQAIFNYWDAADGDTQFMHLWSTRLGSYYARQDSWQGVETMLASYPRGTEWGPWDQSWQVDYILAAADDTIVAASDAGRVGQKLDVTERIVAAPIEEGGQEIGSLVLLAREQVGARLAPGRLLMIGVGIASLSLVVGVLLSRRLSQPLADLTAATRAIAAGDLGVHVSSRYSGEAGELIESFNQMAGDLARADELRRNLTADVAHELRTPLSIVRAKLEGVIDGVYPPTPEHLEPVVETVNLLTQLVEDLHLLALVEAKQLSPEKQPVDIGDVLRDALVNFSPQATDRGVTLALDLPPVLPTAMVDRRRITQVLGNLLSNALRYTPAGGRVTISAAEVESNKVEISVVDSGPGIPSEDLPYVFERFWRGERSRSRAGGGSGLGLAIAKQLVEMHGGTIRVESTPRQGTTFQLTLPVR